MYKINIVCVGSLKEKFYIDAQEEYVKRLKRFCDLKIFEISENPLPQNPSLNEINLSLEKESALIKPLLKGKVIILDLDGEQCSSTEFSNKIIKTFDNFDTLTFVIGSSYGLSKSLKENNTKLGLSKMTLPHHMARIFLEEQIYRAFCILNNITYHK